MRRSEERRRRKLHRALPTGVVPGAGGSAGSRTKSRLRVGCFDPHPTATILTKNPYATLFHCYKPGNREARDEPQVCRSNARSGKIFCRRVTLGAKLFSGRADPSERGRFSRARRKTSPQKKLRYFLSELSEAGCARRLERRSNASDGEAETLPARQGERQLRGLRPLPAW